LPAIALIVLALLERRRFRFAALASVWLLAAALSFVDGRLVPFTATAFAAGDRRRASAPNEEPP
jgi:hypothetical protein